MASAPMEGQARGQRWTILLKIETFLRFIFRSKIEEEDENLSKIEEEDEKLGNCSRWADLPPDLLERILICIPPKDVVRACSACTAWNSVLLASHMCLLRLPWILLQPCMKTIEPFPLITFLCPNENVSFDIHLPFDICDFKDSGIMGWLLVLDRAKKFYLLNPLNQVRIPIPYYSYECEYNGSSLFAMSETNIKTNLFPSSLKILCKSLCKTYLHIKPCTENLKIISSLFDDDQSLIYDQYDHQYMIYYQNKFYVLFKDGGLTICDLNGPYPIIRKIEKYKLEKVASKYKCELFASESYLVQNSGNIYQLLVSCRNFQLRWCAFKLKLDPSEFFLSSHDNIFPAEENYYEDYARKSKWIYDDSTILDVDQISFLDTRKVIFIPVHDGCGFKYLGNQQLYDVSTFTHRDWQKSIFDEFFWFMPANY